MRAFGEFSCRHLILRLGLRRPDADGAEMEANQARTLPGVGARQHPVTNCTIAGPCRVRNPVSDGSIMAGAGKVSRFPFVVIAEPAIYLGETGIDDPHRAKK